MDNSWEFMLYRKHILFVGYAMDNKNKGGSIHVNPIRQEKNKRYK